MKKLQLMTGALFVAGCLASPAAAQGERDAILAMSCAACHGTDGRSPGSIPAIAGKPAAYLQSTMKAFRDGSRPATVMNRLAKGYSDEEIAALARYFSTVNK
jgi:sulfide dehydrogenase cytochrome subunit